MRRPRGAVSGEAAGCLQVAAAVQIVGDAGATEGVTADLDWQTGVLATAFDDEAHSTGIERTGGELPAAAARGEKQGRGLLLTDAGGREVGLDVLGGLVVSGKAGICPLSLPRETRLSGPGRRNP